MNILIAEPLDFNSEQNLVLEKYGRVLRGPFTRKELLLAISQIDVLIIRLAHKIDKELLDQASNLSYILTPTTGLNHIDIVEAEKRDIRVISLKGNIDFLQKIPSTAEHSLALMLSLIRKIPAAMEHVLNDNWDRDQFKSHNINSLTLGILGYGRVGKQMIKYAEALNMPWFFYDTDQNLKDDSNSIKNLNDFLKQIDVLSIHIPLEKENINFLNSKNLKHLKKGSYIINTARAEVIEERALVELLENGYLGGLATDVLNFEQDQDKRKKSPLLKLAKKLDNVIITPHIAGATYESMWLTEEFIIKKWIAYIS